MRGIKFRVWSERYKEFRYWGFLENDIFTGIPTGAGISLKECQDASQQFTGLKDKNGKEIYEGDILKYSDGSDTSHHKIIFDEKYGRWFDERLEDGDSQTAYDDFSFVTECKIVGNIYQNPEWL